MDGVPAAFDDVESGDCTASRPEGEVMVMVLVEPLWLREVLGKFKPRPPELRSRFAGWGLDSVPEQSQDVVSKYRMFQS